ncbi:MAG TPA: CsbD family protein [Anaerolineae bacterium]|nr:CsbD family protein [Anaerolineae bacterium]
MDPTKDILQDKWLALKGQAQQKWPKLTDEDVTQLSGKSQELANLLQQRYGYGRIEADMEIRNWLRHQH